MTNLPKLFMNVGIVAMVAILFAGCSLIPPKPIEKEASVTVEDPSYTEISDDDSLDTIESEIDSTLILDEDGAAMDDVLGVWDTANN